MPVYEQKLISPLAVRFTQEHIRTTFQDGRIVEDSIDVIKTRPAPAGSGYDLILETPFPSIEILRWRVPASSDGASHDSEASEHWFSLDNRRLYCLQVAAMDHFPKSVAAEVDILYDSHKVWRKFDSTTRGRGVSIGHSCKGPEVDSWDWYMEAEATDSAATIARSRAFVGAQKDDLRAKVDDLVNAEEALDDTGSTLSSALAQLARMEALCKQEDAQFRSQTSDVSTAVSDDSGSHVGSCCDTSENEADESQVTLSRMRACLARGGWTGSRGDSYTFQEGKAEGSWICSRRDSNGSSKTFTISYDWDYDLIWWGTAGSYFASAAQILASPREIKWYNGNDVKMSKPKFSWWAWEGSRVVSRAPAKVKASTKSARRKM